MRYAHAIAHSVTPAKKKGKQLKKRCSYPSPERWRVVSVGDDLAALDLANARIVVIIDEPVDGVLEALLERRELELFVVLARLAYEAQQLFVRRRLAELSVRLARIELPNISVPSTLISVCPRGGSEERLVT